MKSFILLKTQFPAEKISSGKLLTSPASHFLPLVFLLHLSKPGLSPLKRSQAPVRAAGKHLSLFAIHKHKPLPGVKYLSKASTHQEEGEVRGGQDECSHHWAKHYK